MIIQQNIEIEQIAIYICRLGYIFCTQCRHEGRGTHPITRTTEPVEYPRETQHLICDGCNRPMLLSIEIIDGSATIEGTAAKIF